MSLARDWATSSVKTWLNVEYRDRTQVLFSVHQAVLRLYSAHLVLQKLGLKWHEPLNNRIMVER